MKTETVGVEKRGSKTPLYVFLTITALILAIAGIWFVVSITLPKNTSQQKETKTDNAGKDTSPTGVEGEENSETKLYLPEFLSSDEVEPSLQETEKKLLSYLTQKNQGRMQYLEMGNNYTADGLLRAGTYTMLQKAPIEKVIGKGRFQKMSLTKTEEEEYEKAYWYWIEVIYQGQKTKISFSFLKNKDGRWILGGGSPSQ